jgi:sec-independent protein translocase protein TatA
LSGVTGHLPEIIIVLVVILIIWGPGKLPDIGGALGKGINEFRRASSDIQDAVMGTTATQATPVATVGVASQTAAAADLLTAHAVAPTGSPATSD